MEQFIKCDFSEEALISRVAHYPELYNFTHPDFKSISKRQRSWKEIAATFNGNVDGDSLSKRWRLLRDSYLRCKRGIVNGKMKRGQTKRKMWKHFLSMSYIDDCANDTSSSEIFEAHNEPLACVTTDSHLIEMEPPTEASIVFPHPTQVKQEPGLFFPDDEMHPTDSVRSTSRASVGSLDSSQEMSTAKPTTFIREGEREEPFNASIWKSVAELEDEDTMFIKCLIPYFKNLPIGKKLELKIKFMQLLLDATRSTSPVTCDRCKMAVISTETVSRPYGPDIDSSP